MKKFISMVMAAAMVVSLVPATAFAAYTGDVEAKVKVVEAAELTKTQAESAIDQANAPELQIKITDADYMQTEGDAAPVAEITVKLSNADFCTKAEFKAGYDVDGLVSIKSVNGVVENGEEGAEVDPLAATLEDTDEMLITVTGMLGEDDVIYVDLASTLSKTSVGTQAKVSVKGDIVTADDLVYATVVEKGLSAETDDLTDVVLEEIIALDEAIEIEPTAGDNFGDVLEAGDKIKLTLNKGFIFKSAGEATWRGSEGTLEFAIDEDNDNVIFVELTEGVLDATKLVIAGIEIEAEDAKAGDVATVTVKGTGLDAVKVDVATVVADGLTISVDEDEDVPEMWSGVNSENYGLNADDDEHYALEVTIEEAFGGSYNDKDEIELVLPEGVFVTDIEWGDVTLAVDEATPAPTEDAEEVAPQDEIFEAAYKKGDHESFVFVKRAFKETKPGEDPMELNFKLELVAVPGFVGDVTLEMLVDGEKVDEVVIATFKTPMVVEAAQNDLKIDYRNTEVPTDVVVKEAEAGLWDKESFSVSFGLDKYISFEDDLVYTVNEEESGMEVDGEDGAMSFTLDKESDDAAAVVTISNISLYMDRNLAAGAYDLEMTWNPAVAAFESELLYAADEECAAITAEDGSLSYDVDEDGDLVFDADHGKNKECYVADVCDYSNVVKEAWINIVTAGREQDDASFTTKVVVPVGAMEIVAGESVVALDVPAYINAAGYTMLPVRAVATALGINNNNVLWDQATKTVTILYGQRIITMQVGSKVVNVNGSAIPASAAVEIVDGRTFLGLRDLATALGVVDITWDAPTQTATLNGNK